MASIGDEAEEHAQRIAGTSAACEGWLLGHASNDSREIEPTKRRNWLFADTVKGAKASAALYSIVSTARANGLEPYAYLRRLFAELPKKPNRSKTSRRCYPSTLRRFGQGRPYLTAYGDLTPSGGGGDPDSILNPHDVTRGDAFGALRWTPVRCAVARCDYYPR